MEKIFELVDLLHLKGANWKSEKTDIQSLILQKIDKLKQNPDFKIKFVNLDALKSLVQKAETPSSFVETAQKQLGIASYTKDLNLPQQTIDKTINEIVDQMTYIDPCPEIKINWNF